jgi:DNA adenine methylase
MTEPFLKWAGGKRLLLPQLLPLIRRPDNRRTYYEPFVGGGAVFFALRPRRAILADSNPNLIQAYEAVRDQVDQVVSALRRLRHCEAEYYRVRSSKPREAHTKAARFIYLNKTCFNGLYRENLDGVFNVPFGRHETSLVTCDVGQLLAASGALATASLRVADFEETVSTARAGDVVFFDPPYTTAHSNNGFIEYNASVFSWQDQFRLSGLVEKLIDEGVHVVMSNADHHSIRELYESKKRITIHTLERWSTIAGKSTKRFPTSELAIVGTPKGWRDAH